MANLPESSTFDAGVYQIETTDPVIGGPSGVTNTPLKNLANRTKYLKDQVDSLASTKAPMASPALTGTPTAPTAAAGTNTTQLATTAFVQQEITGDLATATPLMDGTAAVGTATKLAREDHRHPTDTTRAPLASPAFTGNPTAPTPAQFDNDTSLATTEFVRRALGSNSDATSYGASATLTAADVGKLIVASASGGFTLTLPAASAVQAGGAIEIFNGAGSAITVQRAGTNTIWVDTNGYTKTSMTVGSGDTLRVISNGSSGWILADCSVASTYSSLFSASKANASGYQMLPSGLIIQWGVVSITNGTDGKSYTVTYPIAFPTSCRSVTAQITNSPNNSNYSGNLVTSLTGYTAWVFDRNGAGVVGGQIYWTAIGH